MGKVLLPVSLFTYGCTSVYKVTSVGNDEGVKLSDCKTSAGLGDDTDTSKSPYNNQINHSNIRNYYRLCLSDRGQTFDTDTPDISLQLIITNAKHKKVYYEYTPSAYYRPYCYCSHYCNPYHFDYYIYCDFYWGSGDRLTKQLINYVKGSISLNIIDRFREKMIWPATAEGDMYDASVIKKKLRPDWAYAK